MDRNVWFSEQILSDRGTQFMSNLVQSVFELTGVNSISVIQGSKQENSIVERANREVMRHLRNIVYDVRVIEEWSIYPPFVQRIMNSMVHSSTGVRPCEIVFGRGHREKKRSSRIVDR
jgi:hypothetical protein